MHIVTVIGARPQFIKASVLSRRIASHKDIKESIVHTGQHYDDALSGTFFRGLGIPKPAHNLEVGSGKHGAQTGAIMSKLEVLLPGLNPDLVLVYGDTNTTLAAALVAAKAGFELAHVEAGLRSFRRAMPEEVNRVVTDHLSTILFCSSQASVSQLEREGINKNVHLVGDIMYDAFLFTGLSEEAQTATERYNLKDSSFVLATVHRAENTDNPERLRSIFGAFAVLATNVPTVLSLHPRTQKALEANGIGVSPKIRIIPPCSYASMVGLTKAATVIATDSGGLQKEAYFAGVPCVTLRDETEWAETLEAGWNRIAPPDNSNRLVETITSAMAMKGVPKPDTLYGDGDAAGRILQVLRGRP